MKIHFSYYSKAGQGRKQTLEDYVTAEKLQGLERLLQHGNYDLADLDIRVGPLARSGGLSVKLTLEIKKHILHSEGEGYSITEIFDLALEKIVNQLRKVESIRHTKVVNKIRHNQ